jgi:hypothetical protein
MARRQKIHSTITEHLIPEVGVHGDVWVAKDTQSFWFATRDGIVVNLSDVLNNVPAHTPPRHGKDGRDGSTGPKGESSTGPAGRDGTNGKDSVVPGPAGPVGLRGVGERGEASTVPGPDSATVLAAAREEISSIHAEFADLKLVVTAIHEQNRPGDEYIQFLRTRQAARLAARK